MPVDLLSSINFALSALLAFVMGTNDFPFYMAPVLQAVFAVPIGLAINKILFFLYGCPCLIGCKREGKVFMSCLHIRCSTCLKGRHTGLMRICSLFLNFTCTGVKKCCICCLERLGQWMSIPILLFANGMLFVGVVMTVSLFQLNLPKAGLTVVASFCSGT